MRNAFHRIVAGATPALRPRGSVMRRVRRGRVYRNREGRPQRGRPARTTAAPLRRVLTGRYKSLTERETDITDNGCEEREGAARLCGFTRGSRGRLRAAPSTVPQKRSGWHFARTRARCCASRSGSPKILRYALTLIPYSRAVACSACFTARGERSAALAARRAAPNPC